MKRKDYTRESVERALTLHYGPPSKGGWHVAYGDSGDDAERRYVVHTSIGWTEPMRLSVAYAFVMGVADGKRLATTEIAEGSER